jgi:hypothetical protein
MLVNWSNPCGFGWPVLGRAGREQQQDFACHVHRHVMFRREGRQREIQFLGERQQVVTLVPQGADSTSQPTSTGWPF